MDKTSYSQFVTRLFRQANNQYTAPITKQVKRLTLAVVVFSIATAANLFSDWKMNQQMNAQLTMAELEIKRLHLILGTGAENNVKNDGLYPAYYY